MLKFHDEKFNSEIWHDLKDYKIQEDPTVADKSLYVCTYCQPILNSNKMPSRCVLSGLYTIPIPDELTKLNTLETQLIQRAKCFQTVVRLGTYTGKVPIYNALKLPKVPCFFYHKICIILWRDWTKHVALVTLPLINCLACQTQNYIS